MSRQWKRAKMLLKYPVWTLKHPNVSYSIKTHTSCIVEDLKNNTIHDQHKLSMKSRNKHI